MKQYEQVKELIENLSYREQVTLINIYASNEDYDFYIFEDLDEVLELHYECRELTSSQIKDILVQFREVSPYSCEYVWMDGYGNYQQGTARDAIEEKLDMDLLAQFCIDCPDEVSDILEVPEEEEEDEEDEE